MHLDEDEFLEIAYFDINEIKTLLDNKELEDAKPLLLYNIYYLIIIIINKSREYLRILSIIGILNIYIITKLK